MKRLDNEKSRKIDYSSSVSELETYYSDRYELIKKGNTDLVTLDLMMLGKALDFIHYIKRNLKLELDNTEKSVYTLEEVIDALQRGIIQDNLFEGGENSVSSNAGAYLGLLIIATIGGEWTDTEQGYAVTINDRPAFVCNFIEKRLLGDQDNNIVEFYRSVNAVRRR